MLPANQGGLSNGGITMIMQNDNFGFDNDDEFIPSPASPNESGRHADPNVAEPQQIAGMMYRFVPSGVAGRLLRRDSAHSSPPVSHLNRAKRNARATQDEFGQQLYFG